MGRLWNAKPCRCRKCGKRCPTILSGKAHVVVKHNILYSKAREFLMVGGWHIMGSVSCPKCHANLKVEGESVMNLLAITYRTNREVLPNRGRVSKNKIKFGKIPCPKCKTKIDIEGELDSGLLSLSHTTERGKK